MPRSADRCRSGVRQFTAESQSAQPQSMTDIADPREFPAAADTPYAPIFALVDSSLAETSTARADDVDHAVTMQLVQRLEAGDGSWLTGLFDAAPSVAIARHLWRRLIQAWRHASRAAEGEQIAATLFALPVVIVAGNQTSSTMPPVDGVLSDLERIGAILREHRALGGSQTFALASALVAADAIDVARMPALLRWQREALAGADADRDLAPAPIAMQAGNEAAHLRFIVGTALSTPAVDLLAETDAKGWALPLAQELGRQLAIAGASVLALPRVPATPPAAIQQGRAAQRAVGAQLFASNAIRRLRASVGEPCAVISAHRCPSAPGGGELRLSLSSAFDPRQAEGFRCPLFPTETAGDIASMLIELMHDCRVSDVRVKDGIHADRDVATGLTLLFKSDTVPADAATSLH
jgi:hypothetical protein